MIINKGTIAPAACALALAASLAACGPRGAPPAKVAEAAPPRPDAPEFAACDWREVKGARLSIWSFACGAQAGSLHLEADDGLPGFYLVGGGGSERNLVIRTFAKPAEAPIEATLPAIRAASPGPDTAGCALVPATGEEAAGRYWLEPTGAAKTAWEEHEKNGGAAEPPCGSMGVYFDRAPYFSLMPGHPETVVYADMGSEIQVFYPSTLRLAAQP